MTINVTTPTTLLLCKLSLLLTISTITPCEALLTRAERKKAAKLKHKKQHGPSSMVENHDHVIVGKIEQWLDHFEANEERKFHQRYFYSDRYALNDDGEASALRGPSNGFDADGDVPTYAFLCVGGEGPALDESVLVDSVHCTGDMIELAQKLYSEGRASVHLFALEHRYYGDSYPDECFEDGSDAVLNENLVYLSSKQALADLAHFVHIMNEELLFASQRDSFVGQSQPMVMKARKLSDNAAESMNPDVKWVTFGGSYPGTLAALARSQYPHYIHAAVSSSAPLEPAVDFPGYLEVVGSDLQYEKVGGSDECYKIVKDAHNEISDALIGERSSEESRSRIASMFNTCDKDYFEDEMNARWFGGEDMGVIDIPAQGNDPSCTEELCNIEKICQFMTDPSFEDSPVDRLASISKIQNEGNCIGETYDQFLDYFSSVESRIDNDRSWYWQTCTEFGWYQTCDNDSNCPFLKLKPVSLYLEMCQIAYDVSEDDVYGNIDRTVEYYGGLDIRSSRIMFIDGDVDPWSYLSVTASGNAENANNLPRYWVKGASHHFWTHPSHSSDADEVVEARKRIHGQVKEWLEAF